MNQSVHELLTHFRSQYLENVGVGVRRFSDLSGIRRARLKKLFEGRVAATEMEIAQISIAMEHIELSQNIRNETAAAKRVIRTASSPAHRSVIEAEPECDIEDAVRNSEDFMSGNPEDLRFSSFAALKNT